MVELHICSTVPSKDTGPLQSGAVFTLDNSPSTSLSNTHMFSDKMTLTVTAYLGEGTSHIYRGTLPGDDGLEDVKVVCKLSVAPSPRVASKYQHEATVYENCTDDLQGQYIPDFTDCTLEHLDLATLKSVSRSSISAAA